MTFRKQSEEGYCYPACLKMVIDYAIDEYGIKQKKLGLSKIAKTVKADPNAGTAPGNIELINAELLDSFPEIQMIDRKGGTFQIIRHEIDEKRPVIAWIVLARDEEDILYHSVVINGYEEDLTTLYYVDPEMDEDDHQLQDSVGKFVDEMLTVDGHLIRMQITIKGQQDLFLRLHPISKTRSRRRNKDE